ncbi:MAG: phosphomannomutase [Deltaproteobacteria bacterium]|nr:phosphomannomutase [Deltaproteobacteria bacterium]
MSAIAPSSLTPTPSSLPPTPHPSFLTTPPTPLRFGTSGLRGLVCDMTDLEVYINTKGFLRYLLQGGELALNEPVALAEDLRETDPDTGLSSSPRIGLAVVQAIRDAGLEAVHCGKLPTPTLAYYAASREAPMPCVMITGSHIPANRNGVKFYKRDGEVLKRDEEGILAAVADVRREEYEKDANTSAFDASSMLKIVPTTTMDAMPAEAAYLERYLSLFAAEAPLTDKRVVVYQHSAVGRDLLVRLLESLGAEVIAVGRTAHFVSVDTEDVTAEDHALFARMAAEHHPDAIVSTDGDSDRPLVVDESGVFHRGDVLGAVTAAFLKATYAAVPISCSDAIEGYVSQAGLSLQVERTRIGSPYVVAAMNEALARGSDDAVGWEANGGFLTASDFELSAGTLRALPTRDAVLPILAALLSASRRKIPLSALFSELPQRATGAGLIDDFPRKASQAIVARYSPSASDITEARFERSADGGENARDDKSNIIISREPSSAPETLEAKDALHQELTLCRRRLQHHFSGDRAFGPVIKLNYVDGVRAWFNSGEVVHLRPSGNAPQLRIYAVSDDEARTSAIVDEAIGEPHGTLRRMEREIKEEPAQ